MSKALSAAEKLARRYHTRDPFRIAKESGATVLYSDSLGRVKGLYRVVLRNRFIILNANNSPELSRIVCAHELGHDVLHRAEASGKSFHEFSVFRTAGKLENEANRFAAELLLPEDEILPLLRAGYNTETIAAMTSTDKNLVAFRIDELNSAGYGFRPQDADARFLK